MLSDTYDITYQYIPGRWHTHSDNDGETTDDLLRMLWEMNRKCRVRQNATGEVREVSLARGVYPPLLLHLFFIGISGRCGESTDESAAERDE